MIQKINGNKLKSKFILGFFIFNTLISYGATMYSNINTTALGNNFTLTIEFKNEDKKDYIIEGLENFKVLSKKSYSNYSNINGKSTKTKSDIYSLLPITKGNFELKFKTSDNSSENKLTIDVTDKGSSSTSQGVNIEQIKYERDYYFGEKIPYFENLVVTTSIDGFNYSSKPNFKDFTSKNVTPSNNKNYVINRTTRNGKEAIEIIANQSILEPLSTGEKIINPGIISYSPKTNDFFFDPSLNSLFTTGEEVKVNIIPLPKENTPTNFNNLVGNFQSEVIWDDKDQVNLGDSLTLKVKLYGNANFDSLEKLVSNNYKDFNIYESIINSQESIKEGEYFAFKEFELAFIPKIIGEVSTPEITLPYFDTKNKRYSNFTIPPRKIKVTDELGLDTKPFLESDINNNIPNNIVSKPLEEAQNKIEITTLPEKEVVKSYNFYIISSLLGIIFLQMLVILKLLFDKKPKEKNLNYFKSMKRSKTNKDFYDVYCDYMKIKYNFSPKAHLEEVLIRNSAPEEILSLNRKIHEDIKNNLSFDKNHIIKILKKFN